MQTAWIIIILAGLLEIIWALCIKMSDSCRHIGWTSAGLSLAVISIVILSQAMRHLPASTAYAVWAGVGAAGTAIAGIWLLGEAASPIKVASLILIVAGIVGLRLEEGGGDTGAAVAAQETHLPSPEYKAP
jgi:quaternary ammonium compound-resistance protein SugE